MNPFIRILQLYMIGLQCCEKNAAMWITALSMREPFVGNDQPLFIPGQTFEGMVDESERGMAEAMRAGL